MEKGDNNGICNLLCKVNLPKTKYCFGQWVFLIWVKILLVFTDVLILLQELLPLLLYGLCSNIGSMFDRKKVKIKKKT